MMPAAPAAANVPAQPQRRYCGCARQIPDNMLKATGQSFLYSSVAGTLLTMNFKLGLLSGVGSVVATLIDALIRPLINLCFSREGRESGAYWWTKLCITAILYSCLTIAVTPLIGIELQVGLIASVATRLVLALLKAPGIRHESNAPAEVFTFLYV